MKRIITGCLAFILMMMLGGCSNTPKYDEVYQKMVDDGYQFQYSYVDMESSKGRYYTLKVMPKSFSLKESSYLYVNHNDYEEESKNDSVIVTIYHAQDGQVYGINTNVEQQTMVNGTCFLDYKSMKPLESGVGFCENVDMDKMKEQKIKINEFVESYGLKLDQVKGFYDWYVENHGDEASKETK